MLEECHIYFRDRHRGLQRDRIRGLQVFQSHTSWQKQQWKRQSGPLRFRTLRESLPWQMAVSNLNSSTQILFIGLFELIKTGPLLATDFHLLPSKGFVIVRDSFLD